MTTLILPPRFTDDSNRIRRAALDIGWHIERLMNWRVTRQVDLSDDLVFYGEPLFAAVVASHLGINLLEPPLDWLTTLPWIYVKRDIKFMTLGVAREVKESRFFKPADDKCFAAKVYESGSALPVDLPDETPVLVSEIVEWDLEIRCFVLGGWTQTLSVYSKRIPINTKHACDAAKHFVDGMFNKYNFPEGVVVDVGFIAGCGWAVVEANPAWGSGIYECDPAKVLPVLEACCERCEDA